jgi:hypothetical protein
MTVKKDPNDYENIEDKEIDINSLKDELLEADLMGDDFCMEVEEKNSDEEDFTIDTENDDVEDEGIDNSINFDESESDLDVYFKYSTNNHKLDGKHSLKRDTIFNGKLNEPSIENFSYFVDFNVSEFNIKETGDIPMIERGSIFEDESRKGDELLNKKKLSEDVYHLLKTNTELDFNSPRRKPNKIIFNNYYKMLLLNIDKQYSKSEIFVELAYYFTDNIFNAYKLLDKKYAMSIIMELKEKGHLENLNKIKFI